MPDERDDLAACDVAHVEMEVQTEPVSERGHGEGRDDREFVTRVAMPEVRSASDGRPDFAGVGDQ